MKADPDQRFELNLARSLGRTRAELRLTMSHREYLDWVALAAIEAEEVAERRP